MPDKPFFAYFAPGATHAPHHVPKEWADRYKGKFDQGWDALREETFARQKELGVIPPDCDLTERSPGIPAWDDVDRRAEAGARPPDGGLRGLPREHRPPRRPADRRARRPADPRRHADLRDHRRQRRLGRGLAAGHVQRDDHARRLRRARDAPSSCRRSIDEFGGPEAYNHYAVGWAHAMDTPYQWTKQVASHWGGTRNGTIVHWPRGIKAKGEIRTQFHHVIDVAPTILEVAGLPAARRSSTASSRSRSKASSMAYSFDDAAARRAPRDAVLRDVRQPRHLPQGLDRGDQAPHAVGDRAPTSRRRRSTTTSGSSTTRARTGRRRTTWPAEHPDKLHELQRLWLIEAVKYNVVPLDDRFAARGTARDRPGGRRLIHGQAAAALRRHGAPDRELGR